MRSAADVRARVACPRLAAPGRLVAVLALVLVLGWGCGNGSGRMTTPTAPTAVRTAEKGEAVSADLRDRFLFEHNAQFFGGRTFRWVPPIPIVILTGDPGFDEFLFEQFHAWEVALAGAGGTPFYVPQRATRRVPRRGIFIEVDDFLAEDTGFTHTFAFGEARRGTTTRALALRRLALPATHKRHELPEIRSNGEIRRCAIVLDPVVLDASDAVLAYAIRHEVGHCLGFLGHVPTGVMRSFCCALDITADVSAMMRTLYRLPPGTKVRP